MISPASSARLPLRGIRILDMTSVMLGRRPLSAPGYSRLLTPERHPFATTDGHVCIVP